MSRPVVLLITDLVDSTGLSARLGDKAFADVCEAHDRVVRTLSAAWRGREINRSDGVLMCFKAVGDAAEFAIAYHEALGRLDEPLSARVGIHVGSLDVRIVQNGDGSGATTNRMAGLAIAMTSRVMAIAAGGQTLMTADAHDALGATSHTVRAQGHWRLKGIAEPAALFEIGRHDAAFVPPVDGAKAYRVVRHDGEWVPCRQIPHSLPAPRDSFVGRARALRDLVDRLDGDARLVTVVGPGGVGKTRLVQHFGRKWLGDFDGGVWFCDLAQAVTQDGIAHAMANGLDVALADARPLQQIATAIAGRGRCLVIVDNFEQVAAQAPETIGLWLDHAPDARFIVTSRNILGLDGESVYRLDSLSAAEGADLFVARATAARGDFDRSQHEATLAGLIRLLDGIPLAIELAAARTRIMDLAVLQRRMSERFTLLASSGGRTGRHATLRATLDWSWDLLLPVERCALVQTSAFDGGFDLTAFEAVIDLDRYGPATVPFDVLQSLVEKSWVQQSPTLRFDLLSSVQEYAFQHLVSEERVDGGGTALRDATWERHGRHYASLDEHAVTAERCVEIDNLAAAVRRAVACGAAERATLALANCWVALKQCGPYRAAESLAASVRAMPGVTAGLLCRIDYVAGSALQGMGRTAEAEACLARGLEAARAGGARVDEAKLLCAIGEQHTKAGRDEAARRTLDEALDAATAVDEPMLRCTALNALGTLAQASGDDATALTRYREALAFAELTGHRRWAGALLGNMGIALYGLGDLPSARDHYERALAIADRFGDLRWVGNMRSNLGLLLADQGAHADARAALEDALRLARHLGHLRLESIALWNLGISATAEGQADAALAHYRAARTLAERLGDARGERLLTSEIEKLEAPS